MDNQKKFGTLIMVISVVLAIASLLLAHNDYPGLTDIPMNAYLNIYSITFFPETEIFNNEYGIQITLKYLLLICVLVFALGYLIKQNIIPVPKKYR